MNKQPKNEIVTGTIRPNPHEQLFEIYFAGVWLGIGKSVSIDEAKFIYDNWTKTNTFEKQHDFEAEQRIVSNHRQLAEIAINELKIL